MSIALDQRAVDEHVAIANDLRNLDSFLAGFFRDGGGDAGPVISSTATERCEILITRPKTIPGVCKLRLSINVASVTGYGDL